MPQKHAVGTLADEIAPRIRAALAQLAEAHQYAQDAGRDVWDFAVEIHSLCTLGLTRSDFRWLVCKGYVEHAREVTQLGEDGRAFRPSGDLTFTKRTCFVLTETGALLARSARDASPTSPELASDQTGGDGDDLAGPQVPEWDPQRHELRVGGRLVKRFKLPSPNQETILMAFQEEGWPPSIDDPLPPQPEQDPKRRLYDTVKSLNRNQKNRLIRFMGNGTGNGVRWETIDRSESRQVAENRAR